MNRHVGASFTLSVLFVVFFAVILYQPEHARHSPPNKAPDRDSADPSPSAPTTGLTSAPTPGIPLSGTEQPSEAGEHERNGGQDAASSTVAARRSPTGSNASGDREEPPSRRAVANTAPVPAVCDPPTQVQIVSRRRVLEPSRREAFTHVGEGESLTDVAIRIYGTSDATRTLWLANRDIIDRRDAPLRVGVLLRTP